MNEKALNNLKLLDALEYIDDEYIASAARFRMNYEPTPATPPKMTWRTPLKHWRHLAALAACILLLSIASPLVSYIAQVISNFNAGAGSGTSESTETEEISYLQFSPDLEPISQELVEEIHEKFFAHYSDYSWTLDEFYEKYGEEADVKFYSHYRVIRNYDVSSPYLGTIGDYVIFTAFMFAQIGPLQDEIAGYTFETHTYVYCTETKTMCKIKEAYEQGLLKDRHIKLLAERRQEFIDFAEANKDIPIRITEKEYSEYKNKGE